MEKTLPSSMMKDTKLVLQTCREHLCPIVIQAWGKPILIIMDAATFDYQYKPRAKPPKEKVRVAYRPLRMPITTLKNTGETVDACNAANEPIYLQKYNTDELVMMSCAVYERLMEEARTK